MKAPLLSPLRIFLCLLFFVLAIAPQARAEKRIGIIMSGDIPYYAAIHQTFVEEINRLFANGEEIDIILQRPFPNPISWSNAARKLIAYDVDLIVTYGLPATEAVLHEKGRIPLVYAGILDPEPGLVAGGNVTGCGFKIPLPSLVRYLKQLKAIDSLGIVFSSIEEDSVQQSRSMEELARQQNITAEGIDIRSRADLETLKGKTADAVFLTGSSIAHLWLADIVSTLQKGEIPAADIFPDDSGHGVLIALYNPPHLQGEMSAKLATRVLLGEKATNLTPHVFRDTELVFNLLAARHLGITFPRQLMTEATKIIQ